MNEEIQEQQVQEEVQPEVVEQQQEQQAVEQPEETQTQQKFEDNKFEENIRSLRESKEQAEYERDQLARYVENIKQQLGATQPQQQQQNDLGIGDDDYVEGRQLKNVSKNIKQLEKEVQQWKNYSEEMTAELKLNSEFSDFSDTVTADNVKALIKKHPELRSSVQNNDPLYSRGKATYKLIKKFMCENTQQKVNKVNQKKVQDNIGKPRSSSAVKDPQNSPLTEAGMLANGYNEEVGAALEQEMYDAISRY